MHRLLPLLLIALLSAGCFHARGLSRVQHTFAEAHPDARFEQEFALSLGPLGLAAAGWLASGVLDPEERIYARYLFSLDRLTLGVYNVEGLSRPAPLPRLARLHRSGWRTLLKVREADETVWILHRTQGRRLRDLYVFTLTEDELVLVHLNGDLGRLLTHFLAEHDVFSALEEIEE